MSSRKTTMSAFDELEFSDAMSACLTRSIALTDCLKAAAHHHDEPDLAEVAYAAYESLERAQELHRDWDRKSRHPRAVAAQEAERSAHVKEVEETPIDAATLGRLQTFIKNERLKLKKHRR